MYVYFVQYLPSFEGLCSCLVTVTILYTALRMVLSIRSVQACAQGNILAYTVLENKLHHLKEHKILSQMSVSSTKFDQK